MTLSVTEAVRKVPTFQRLNVLIVPARRVVAAASDTGGYLCSRTGSLSLRAVVATRVRARVLPRRLLPDLVLVV